MQQGLSPVELEAALRLVTLFPRGMDTHYLRVINGARAEVLGEAIRKMVESFADGVEGTKVIGQLTPVLERRRLLELVKTVSVPAVAEFRAADKFRPGETVDGVRISSSMGDNFKTYFLPKVERNVPATEIRVHKLLRNSKDLSIRAEIGKEREGITLAHLWELLKLQGNGQNGTLLTNGWANIFYIVGTDGNLWAVSTYWCDDGWCLSANSVAHPREWFAGHQVCSR